MVLRHVVKVIVVHVRRGRRGAARGLVCGYFLQLALVFDFAFESTLQYLVVGFGIALKRGGKLQDMP